MSHPVPSANRRRLLLQSARCAGLLAALGRWPAAAAAQPGRAAFEARTLPALLQALGAATPQASDALSLSVPDFAENGAVVPVAIASTLPGVRQLLLLVENNPTLLCALFEPSPVVEPDFSLRVKLAESTDVVALALMADGRAFHTTRHVTVVLGGCG